jgi:hypothetical protein
MSYTVSLHSITLACHRVKFVYILDNFPTCNDNVTGNQLSGVEDSDRVEVKCNVTYRGNWRPQFECLPAAKETNNNTWTVSDTVYYSHTVNVTRSLHDTFISCRISSYTQQSNSGTNVTISNATADNYHFQWKSKPINVTCKFYQWKRQFSIVSMFL